MALEEIPLRKWSFFLEYNVSMAELKTIMNDNSVEAFIDKIENNQRRGDAIELLAIFEQATGMKPKLWGASIIGYGAYHYKSERSNQEGDWPLVGFSPRKANLTVYIMPGFDTYEKHLSKLGKHKTSVSCIYINKLSDIDTVVLGEIIKKSVAEMQRQYPLSQAT